MKHEVLVAPSDQGWTVCSEDAGVRLEFPNGALAEAEARRIARELAAGGRPAEVRVHLRDGGLAGRILCAAEGPDRVATG
ncbi:MAG: DUF6894 family protein [Phenylobacterium sp.]|jgi:hypothetical protein|uniref:DUF6894 family protein n=1 Tax=Phenylobacterium sp. TaxID=1871053 RepID=UPI00391ADF83